jgi:hypothetical protein
MPDLLLDVPDPFSSTLGIMLYPDLSEEEVGKAKTYASQFVAEPLRRAIKAGHRPRYETLIKIATGGGADLDDVEKRFEQGLWVGDIYKAYYALAESHRGYASMENAMRIADRAAAASKSSGSRTGFFEAKKRYASVAHLWAAWSLRNGSFSTNSLADYGGFEDFLAFLKVSEIFRDWGQTWRPGHANAVHPLPEDVWRVPESWLPGIEQVGWPVVRIPPLSLPEHCFDGLKPVRG